jgi:hypothetical protein
MSPRWCTLASIALLAAACSGDSNDETGGTVPSGHANDSTNAAIAGAGQRVCADPSLRASQRFDLKTASEQPMSDFLISGGGLVAADFTGDDLPDLFAPSDASFQFWTQSATGVFTEEEDARFPGITIDMGVGGSAVDYDGDGDLDLFVTRLDLPCMLLENDGTGHFTDVTAASGLGVKSARWQSSSWGDMDGDGDLDLVVGAYGDFQHDAFSDALPPGDPSALYANNGDGTFTDVSERLPQYIQEAYTFMTAWYDVDGDSLPELFFVNDFATYHHSEMLWNKGGTFVEADSSQTGFQQNFFGMGFGVGDVNEDGMPDFLLTSWDAISLLESLGGTAQWLEAAQSSGPVEAHETLQRYGWGADIVDIDDDADLDLVVGYGQWTEYAYNRPDQPDSLWLNDGANQFSEVALLPEWGLDDRYVTRGVAALDLNHDGWLDLVKRELDYKTPLRTARCGAESWAEFSLRMPPPNTFSIGAKVRVTAAGKSQTRWIQSGSSSMYTGLPAEAHFGLGVADTIDAIDVTWPDGVTSHYEDEPARQRFTITRTE